MASLPLQKTRPFRKDVPRDALTHAETLHLRRSGAVRPSRFYGILWAGTLAASVLFTSAYLIQITTDSAARRTFYTGSLDNLLTAASVTSFLLGFMLFLHFLLLITRALQLSSSMISREKQARSWELLVLTGVTARQIVLGKWRSTLTLLWRQNRYWLIWRMFSFAWLGFSFQILGLTQGDGSASITAWQFLCGILIGTTFIVSQAIFASSIGALASCLSRRPAAAYQVGFGLHLLVTIGCLGLTALITLAQFFISRGMMISDTLPFYSAMLITMVTPLEGGTISGITALTTLDATNVTSYVIAIFLGNGFFLLLSWGILRLAEWFVRRQGALAA